MEHELIAGAVLARDEEENLPGCLESLSVLTDHIAVLDTGSLDGTAQAARDLGAFVTSQAWEHDFAAARNRLLDLVSEATFVIVLDADERLVCPEPDLVRSMIAGAPSSLDAYQVQIVAASYDMAIFQPRLLRPRRVQYVGAVDETIVSTTERMPITTPQRQLSILHRGQAASRPSRRLAIAGLRWEHDQSIDACIEFVSALVEVKDPAACAFLDYLLNRDVEMGVRARGLVLTLRASVAIENRDHDVAVSMARAALALDARNDRAANVLISGLQAQGDTAGVLALIQERAHIPISRDASASGDGIAYLRRALAALDDAGPSDTSRRLSLDLDLLTAQGSHHPW